MRISLLIQPLAFCTSRSIQKHVACKVYGTRATWSVQSSHIHTTGFPYAKYPGLVSTDWLAEAMTSQKTPDGKPLRILDATRIGMETGKDHIPGSLHIDLNELQDKTSPYRFTVPTAESFAEYVGKTLGIDNDSHVVLYETKVKVMTAPRIWWMFRFFNHEAVSVLNGGLQTWVAENRPVTEEPTSGPTPVEFKVSQTRGDLFKSYEDILENVKEPKFQIMDARLVEWYNGSMPSVYPGIKLGIMKSATNIPFPNVLVDDGSDKFKSPDDLQALFKSRNIDLSRPLTSSCFIGVTASILALSAFHAGKEDVAVFDGSWEEYSQKGPEDSMNLYEPRII